MRGKRFRVVEYLRPDRNIPAYAGKTSHGTACGLLPCGTSPRMRGKPQATPPTARTTGNIPAYAGKTLWHAPGVGDTWEHPRVCGENPTHATPRVPQSGTSPRMRGKPSRCGYGTRWTRNIPAYAGKTCAPPLRAYGCWEHPRVCGENVSPTPLAQFEWGTSPRMRGKRLRPALFAIENGNIPAYAGKTFALYLWVLGFQEHPRVCGKTRPCSIMGSNWSEHPRVCGENLHAGDKRQVRGGTSPRMRGKPPESITSAADRGTSPRMRGKHSCRGSPYIGSRNIPAYAGKTGSLPGGVLGQGEHPRVCGENPNSRDA